MTSKDNLVLDVTNGDRIVTIRITATEKIKLSDLAELIYLDCLNPRGKFYMHHTREVAYEIEFTNSENQTHHFYQNSLWLNPITLLSDISRQIYV